MGNIPCLVCGRNLTIDGADRPLTRSSNGSLRAEMVMDGVVCQAHGNYGSTVYDPLSDTEMLGFAICDPCFQVRWDRMRDGRSLGLAAIREDDRTDNGSRLWKLRQQIGRPPQRESGAP